jgi:hypothetical protein
MEKILMDSGLLEDIAGYSMNEGTEFSLTPSGMSSGRGFKDNERLTYFTFEGDIYQGRVDGDYNEGLLIFKRSQDEKHFGVTYLAPVIEDRFYRSFEGELTELRELEVTEKVTVIRSYAFAE